MSSIELESQNTQGKHESVYIHVEENGKAVDNRSSSSSPTGASSAAAARTANGHSHHQSKNDSIIGVEQPLNEAAVPARSPVSIWHPPAETLQIIIQGGNARANRSTTRTLLLSLIAGILISFGGNMNLYIASTLSQNATWTTVSKIAGSAVFPFGLMFIFMHQGELFTGNVMFLLAAVFNGTCSVWGLIRNWVLCFIGNYAGTVVFAYFISDLTEVYYGAAYQTYLAQTVLIPKVNLGWGQAVLKAVACNFLVCTSVWWFNSAQDLNSKLIGVWWPIFCFVVSGFEHCIANMFYLMTALMVTDTETWGTIFAWNIIPVTLGNIIGAALFIIFQFIAHGHEAKVSQKTAVTRALCLPEGRN